MPARAPRLILASSRCPSCRGSLIQQDDTLRCASCASCFPVLEGIARLRVGDAAPQPQAPGLDLSILLLTFNEADNLRLLLPPLREVLEDLHCTWEVVVMDGGSSDDTTAVAAEHGARVLMQVRPGYGAAYREGVAACQGERIAVLDADLSHDPGLLRVLWRQREAADLLIGSRYVDGGGADTVPMRLLLSRILNGVFRTAVGTEVHDLSSGYRLVRRAVMQSLPLRGRDFDVVVEASSRVVLGGHLVREVPMFYKPRGAGVSKVRLARFARSYALMLTRIVGERMATLARLGWQSLPSARQATDAARLRLLRSLIEPRDAESLLLGDVNPRLARVYPRTVICADRDDLLHRLARHTGLLVQGDLDRLPFADETFAHVVLFLENRGQLDEMVLGEARRVLRPGGNLVIVVPQPRAALGPCTPALRGVRPDDVGLPTEMAGNEARAWSLGGTELVWSVARD